MDVSGQFTLTEKVVNIPNEVTSVAPCHLVSATLEVLILSRSTIVGPPRVEVSIVSSNRVASALTLVELSESLSFVEVDVVAWDSAGENRSGCC